MNFWIQNGLQTWFQNGFQTWFQNNFQMGNNFNMPNNRFNQEEEEEENSRYPWLKPDQIERLEMVADQQWLKGQEKINYMDDLYRQLIPTINNQNTLDKRDEEINRMHYDESKGDISKRELKKQKNRLIDLAQQVKKIYPDMISADEDDEVVIQNFIVWLQQAWYNDAYKDYAEYIKSWDKDKFFSKYNISNSTASTKEQTGIGWLWRAGIGIWTIGTTAWLLAWPAEKIWNIMYQNSMPKTMKDSRAEIDEMASTMQKKTDLKNQKSIVKEAEKALEKAKQTGEWVEGAQTTLDEAKAWLKEIKERWIKEADTTMDTWLEFNIRGWIKKMASQAKVAKDKVRKDEIKNVIDNSTQKVNVLDITNKFVSDNTYKWLNGKVQKETAEALRNIQKYYGRNSDLWSVSLADLQDLKSSIMDDLADAYQSIANWDRAKLTTEEELLEKYASTLKNTLQEAMQKETDVNVKKAFKKRADLDRIYWEWIKTNAKKEAGKITDNIWTRATQQLRSRGWWTLSKVGWWIKNIRNKAWKAIKEGGETILKDIEKNAGKKTKNIIKNWLKKWVKWLLDPVAIVMPDSRDIIDSQELWIPTLKRIASWKPSYTDKKMEELLNKEWATYDTAIAEMLDHLKNNDEFDRTATRLKKNRVTTYREAVEELWKEDPDELIELFENYLSQKWSGWR